MIILSKGQKAPLPYSHVGRERVTVGISWDTPEIIPDRPDEMFVSEMDEGINAYTEDLDITVGYTQETYDLDLVCLIYNQDKVLIDAVSPAAEENVDMSGAIYHTGDDTAGISAGDDEQISIELANLPEDIHHLVFLTLIQSGHQFGQVLKPMCRVADGKTNETAFEFFLAKSGEDGANKTACVMLCLSKGENGIWGIKNISEYRIDKDIQNWGDEAAKLIAN